MRELELVVSSREGRSYLVSARSAAGDTPETPTTFPFDDRGLARRLQDVELALAKSAAVSRRVAGNDERPIQELGKELFAFLFPDRVRDHFSAERTQAARDDTSVQIRLRIRPPELAALPWELLYDPARDDYLCLTTPVVRYLEVFEPVTPLAVAGPVRVLGMAARPGALNDLDVEREKRWLHDALTGLVAAGKMDLAWASGQTWRDLQDSLDRTRPNVFHFIGHGGFDAERDEGLLALADEDGGAYRMPASNLALLFGDYRSLRLVVLNSCEGARASAGDVFSSTAAVLTRRGIPAVVAMQYDISDQAAIAFARGLYGAIANGLGVDQAVTRARRAIRFSRSETLEWATPVLYLRSSDTRLFDLTRPTPTPVVATPARQEPAPREPEQQEQTPPRPDERRRVARDEPKARRAEPAGALLIRIDDESPILGVAFGPDGTRLATASDDGTARIWDAATGGEMFRMRHKGPVVVVTFSPDGTRLASASRDGTARIWDTGTGHQLARMGHVGYPVEAVAFGPDGARLATESADGIVRIWGAATGRELVRMTNETYGADVVVFSPDGKRLATASYHGRTRIWDADTGRELARMTHPGVLNSLAFSPDGTRLATASTDRTARIWDAATGQQFARMTHDSRVWALAFSPDGTRLATASSDSTARTWDTATGGEVTRMTHQGRVDAVAFSPDGTRVATGSRDRTARTWDAATGREVSRLAHGGAVSALAFSPDGARLATVSDDKAIRIWAV